MPRPNYNEEQLRELTQRYQAASYTYAGAIMDQLAEMEEQVDDGELDANSQEYQAKKANLNSLLYLTVRNAMDARDHIAQGYPPRFSQRNIEAMSGRMMQDPTYADYMKTHTFEVPDQPLAWRNAQHEFRTETDQQLGANYQSQTVGEDALPQEDRARRAVVLRQVLKELEATGTGYYIPGIRRGRNSTEFENVKTEVRRQIAMLEGNMPLSAADDDRMLQMLDVYSNGKQSNRTRGFGNTRQRSILKLYAEYTQHPAPRPQGNAPLHTPQEIERQFNEAKGLNDDRYVNHDDYVSFARPEYTEMPGRTVQEEFNDSVQVLRDLTELRRVSGQALTATQQATYREHVLRAVALQNVMVSDPAGPAAKLNGDEIRELTEDAANVPFVNGALDAANRSWEHMNELTRSIAAGYRPRMSRDYRRHPEAFNNTLLQNLQTISYPTIGEQLAAAKNDLRDLGLEGGPLTLTQTSQLRQAAIKVMALSKLASESEHGGREHLSPGALAQAIQDAPDESEIQKAVDTAMSDPAKAQELSELLTGDIEYGELQNRVASIARGGIENMVDTEETRISELPNHTYNEQERTQAENEFIRFAALNNVRNAHQGDDEPNPYVTDEEIAEAENALRQDNVFMGSVQGQIRDTDGLKNAAIGLATLRYEKHRQRAEHYMHLIETDPDAVDVSKGALANEFAAMTAIRNLQRQAGSDNVIITDAQLEAEVETVKLGDAHLALNRGIEQEGAALGRQLMGNTFNRSGDAYVQAHAQNVVSLRSRFPYPEFRPGSIGAAYAELGPVFNPQDPNETLARTREGREQLANHVVRALALRQLTMDSPDGAYTRLSQNQLRLTEERIKADPRYAGTLERIKTQASYATQTMTNMRNAPDLNALKARYNRARGNEFIDPAAGAIARQTASQWADREMQTLTDAYGQQRQWTPQRKQHLIQAYARMHVMREHIARNPGREEEILSLNVINGLATNEFLKRPGVKEKMDELFADPSKTVDHTIRNQRRTTWMDLQLSDADRVAKLMALGSLEKKMFPDALITPAELEAEEQKIRSSLSYQQIDQFLQTGGKLEDIEPANDVNYFDAMENRAFELPGVQPGYENHRKILLGQLRTLQQQGRQAEMGQALAELYIIAQYQQDGIPYDKLPPVGEIGRRGGLLAATDDFKSAVNALKENPEELNTLLEGAEQGMGGADMAQMLNGLAAQDRLKNAPDDMREPNVLHEVRAQVMADAYTPLLEGNAEEKWVTEAQKLNRRDDFLRFTAMNRIYAEHPDRAFISEAELNAGVEALKNDQQFMTRLNERLDSPLQLRAAVFNSAGIQRWSDTAKMKEYRQQLQDAKQAEAEGHPETHGFLYGMVANQLAGVIEARLSGREIDNSYLNTRDLNLLINEVQFSDRYRAIENAIQADVKEFDRLSNLFQLPPEEFKTAYEALTDEFIEKYPSVPMKDTNTVGNHYNKALEGVRSAAQEDPAAIAASDEKRAELAQNIREMFLDRRIILTAPQDPQLMKRKVTIYDNPKSQTVADLRDQAEESVDNMLGDLNERLKDPKVVEGYVNALKDAGDLRVLADEEYHSKEVFADPLVQKLRAEGIAMPEQDGLTAVQNAAAQVLAAPEGETPEQREQRLQGQIAGVLNKALMKELPADERPNTMEQAVQEDFIKNLPDFQLAVKKMANDPQALEAFVNAANGGASGAELAKLLDQNAIAQGKTDVPESDPASNILFFLRKNSMAPHRDGLYHNTTGKGMTSWMRGQREVALDHCVRVTAVNKLLHENPDRVYFSNAEIMAQYKKVLENKEYIDMLERNAKNGLHLRGEFFGYQGVMTWDQMTGALGHVEMSKKQPALAKDVMGGAWYSIAEIIGSKRSGKVTNNEDASSAEKRAFMQEYEKTDEYKMLESAFKRKPDLLKHYVLDVFTATDAEFDAKHNAFVEQVRALEMDGVQQQAQPNLNQAAEEAANLDQIEDDLEIQIDGQKFDIKGEGDNVHLEEQAVPQPQAENVIHEEPEQPAVHEPVGWPAFKADETPLKVEGDPTSAFNQTRAELDAALKQPVVDPETLKNGFGTLYITALLEKAGKPVTPENIEGCRGHLAEDKVYQKYMTKCLSDRRFAQQQLNGAFVQPDAEAMRNSMKTAAAQPAQEIQAAPGTPMAQFRENLQKLNFSQKMRYGAEMGKEDINRFAMQMCKTVALYNLSQSPDHQNKPVDYEDMKAEALRLKDDPAMKKSIWVAVKDPAVQKAMIEGMNRTQNDPQHFSNFVQGIGDDPKLAKEWLDATYHQEQPAVQPKAGEKEKNGPQAGPAPQA